MDLLARTFGRVTTTIDRVSLSEKHRAKLTAERPGAPIVGQAEELGMRSSATSYSDFMKFSRWNLDNTEYPDWRSLHYPLIYYQDLELFSCAKPLLCRADRGGRRGPS